MASPTQAVWIRLFGRVCWFFDSQSQPLNFVGRTRTGLRRQAPRSGNAAAMQHFRARWTRCRDVGAPLLVCASSADTRCCYHAVCGGSINSSAFRWLSLEHMRFISGFSATEGLRHDAVVKLWVNTEGIASVSDWQTFCDKVVPVGVGASLGLYRRPRRCIGQRRNDVVQDTRSLAHRRRQGGQHLRCVFSSECSCQLHTTRGPPRAEVHSRRVAAALFSSPRRFPTRR